VPLEGSLHAVQIVLGEVEVPDRGHQVPVPQDRRDLVQGDAVVEQVAGEGVTQLMKTDGQSGGTPDGPEELPRIRFLS
jgi:hypothetical protein